ncbi:MAG: hypothetical protein V4644_00480 [Patescibacteria group bacterium]
MTTPIRAAGPDDSISEFRKILFDTVDMLCQTLWQIAAPAIQEKYPRFALSTEAFEARASRFEDESPITTDELISALDGLVPLRKLYPGSLGASGAGIMLEHVSFAGCMIGAEASAGDLEHAMRSHQLQPERYEGLMPRTIYKRYKAGQGRLLLFYLNTLLGESSRRLCELTREPFALNTQRQLFCYDPSDDHFVIDHAVVGTFFPLHASLVRYIEPVSGHA